VPRTREVVGDGENEETVASSLETTSPVCERFKGVSMPMRTRKSWSWVSLSASGVSLILTLHCFGLAVGVMPPLMRLMTFAAIKIMSLGYERSCASEARPEFFLLYIRA